MRRGRRKFCTPLPSDRGLELIDRRACCNVELVVGPGEGRTGGLGDPCRQVAQVEPGQRHDHAGAPGDERLRRGARVEPGELQDIEAQDDGADGRGRHDDSLLGVLRSVNQS